MGLDVYLSKAPGPDFNWDAEDAYDQTQTIEKESQFPEHYWKIGYWRSSYNDAGFNSVVRRWQGCMDLYDIVFGSDTRDDGLWEIPIGGWTEGRKRALAALEKFRAKREDGQLALQAFFAEYDASNELVNAPQHAINRALKQFREHAGRADNGGPLDFSSWSSNKGTYFSKGITVNAVIPGTHKSYRDMVGVWIVTGVDPKELDHYEECYQIVIATMDEVINSGEPERYRLSWSA